MTQASIVIAFLMKEGEAGVSFAVIFDNELIDLSSCWKDIHMDQQSGRPKEWEEHFPGAIQVALSIRSLIMSLLIKLSSIVVNCKQRPFKFENCWLLYRLLTKIVGSGIVVAS